MHAGLNHSKNTLFARSLVQLKGALEIYFAPCTCALATLQLQSEHVHRQRVALLRCQINCTEI